jgi:D-serine deaminase-like pyridoxal phosphate-dependent protein
VDLETPIPVVDLDRLEQNLDRMAVYTSQHNLALRPHAKTHKSPRIAAEQIRRGAVGLTCATLLEAEVMAEVSSNLLLAYPPVGRAKLHRLLTLPENIDLTVALDSIEVADQLGDAARVRGRKIAVLVELDVGMRRVGIGDIGRAIELARFVRSRAPLYYRGIAFYPGHIRAPIGAQDEPLHELAQALQSALRALDQAGLRPEIVSGGSTPTAWQSHEIRGVTEVRPGTYVYNDRSTHEIGACSWDDCALTVLATVVSTAVSGQAVIDAGSKALGREPLEAGGNGFGAVLERPEVIVSRLSEEHGILDLRDTDWRPAVGERVRVVPNHACVAVHLHEEIHGFRAGRREASWPVAARGRKPISQVIGV